MRRAKRSSSLETAESLRDLYYTEHSAWGLSELEYQLHSLKTKTYAVIWADRCRLKNWRLRVGWSLRVINPRLYISELLRNKGFLSLFQGKNLLYKIGETVSKVSPSSPASWCNGSLEVSFHRVKTSSVKDG